jgi:hypothetical protein
MTILQDNERDLAHEADMRALMRQQLHDNISVEEANEDWEEAQANRPLRDEWDDQDTLDWEYDLDEGQDYE